MFTGLVEDMGTVEAVEGRGPLRLTIACDRIRPESLALGESIASAGVCLTVVSTTPGGYVCEAGQETLERTTVGRWKVGTRVNLERALRVGDRLGGHIVLGHVDGVGTVRGRREAQGVLHLEVEMPDAIAPLVCEKGSIAVDGVSLTVNAATRTSFRVTLIPETRRRTTLDALAPGDPVNLEADILARHLARMLAFGLTDEGGAPRLDLDFLAQHGYV
ncbi:MAG: riboflavin synthase [Deltaproteobacteria bacterium]|nr:MAG: riboflavin synthase [Deltaproteobacteria bacterium]